MKILPSFAPVAQMSSPLSLPECFIRTFTSQPDAIICRVVDAESLSVTEKSWSHFMHDAFTVARRFVASGLPVRLPGQPVMRVPTILRGGYAGFITIVAICLNRWTVSVLSCYLSLSQF